MDHTKNKILDMGHLLRRFATFFGIEQALQKYIRTTFGDLSGVLVTK